ncbi:hypothetical protein [Sinorhizobium meliloti]|uniref:hypothetical protein n=1 Tax=Rhizobium meliloti TaxID=382 RepID=UPI00299E4534
MSDLSEPKTGHLDILARTEHNIARLLPLLNLLEMPEGSDRIAKLMELLRLILDAQQRQVVALKSVADKMDRLSRR